jgi:hypothetical protein
MKRAPELESSLPRRERAERGDLDAMTLPQLEDYSRALQADLQDLSERAQAPAKSPTRPNSRYAAAIDQALSQMASAFRAREDESEQNAQESRIPIHPPLPTLTQEARFDLDLKMTTFAHQCALLEQKIAEEEEKRDRIASLG